MTRLPVFLVHSEHGLKNPVKRNNYYFFILMNIHNSIIFCLPYNLSEEFNKDYPRAHKKRAKENN